MDSELESLKLNHTWDLVSLPHGKLAIGHRCVYMVKLKASGEVERFKARLVAKGYNKQEGLDYHEAFSHVIKMATVRIVLSLAAQHNWHIHQLDVYNVFLQGDFDDGYTCSFLKAYQVRGSLVVEALFVDLLNPCMG